MTSATRAVPLLLALALIVGCRSRTIRGSDEVVPTERCFGAGATLDSAEAVRRAAHALESPGVLLRPRTIQAVRDEGIEIGLLVSLAVAQPPNVAGGGGMVWVDLESGCALVLRRYE